jgi:hypothetical protein
MRKLLDLRYGHRSTNPRPIIVRSESVVNAPKGAMTRGRSVATSACSRRGQHGSARTSAVVRPIRWGRTRRVSSREGSSSSKRPRVTSSVGISSSRRSGLLLGRSHRRRGAALTLDEGDLSCVLPGARRGASAVRGIYAPQWRGCGRPLLASGREQPVTLWRSVRDVSLPQWSDGRSWELFRI